MKGEDAGAWRKRIGREKRRETERTNGWRPLRSLEEHRVGLGFGVEERK